MSPLFTALLLTVVCAAIIGAVDLFFFGILAFNLLSISLFFMGIVVIVFPYATHEQFAEYGVKKTVILVRIMGVVVAIAINILFALFAKIL